MSTGLVLNRDSLAVVLVFRIPLVPVAFRLRDISMMDYVLLGEAELASSSEFRGFREVNWESFILFS